MSVLKSWWGGDVEKKGSDSVSAAGEESPTDPKKSSDSPEPASSWVKGFGGESRKAVL